MKIRLRNPKVDENKFKKFKTIKFRLKRMKVITFALVVCWIARELSVYY